MALWSAGGYEPHVHIVDDPVWGGTAADDVIAVFLADAITMQDHEEPLLAVAVAVATRDKCESDEEWEAYNGSVRTFPAAIHDIHANLPIANLDVAEAARTDAAGIFRSF
ncbi:MULTISPECIES: DUF6924 domain-containing protein [unclassified Streptomyces]|uniref:DUF6924 domain-containing protein n=1 Tax=unclassified Streptomyces TaxID=2593676 RepID=UPI003829B928